MQNLGFYFLQTVSGRTLFLRVLPILLFLFFDDFVMQTLPIFRVFISVYLSSHSGDRVSCCANLIAFKKRLALIARGLF